MSKIVGVTVGTPISPQKIKEKINPVLSVNGVKPDENGNVKIACYEGDYEITPRASEQALATKDKFMVNDVTIEAIPFFEVSNNSGGNTVYIGTLNYPSKKAVLGKAKLGIMKL